MDEIITKIRDPFIATLTLRDGSKMDQPAVAIHTYWKSGRKDCEITILKTLSTVSTKEQ